MKTLLISILLFCTQPALAALTPDDMEWVFGSIAYSKGDYATALQKFKPIAAWYMNSVLKEI